VDEKEALVTESYPSQASPEAQAALGKLAAQLADPEKRKAFASDAQSALADWDVDLDLLPDEVIRGFSGLTYDELTIISDRCEELVRNGFYAELPGGGRNCLF
jgi:hypothetical protein